MHVALLAPRELVVMDAEPLRAYAQAHSILLTEAPAETFAAATAAKVLRDHFRVSSLDNLEIGDLKIGVRAAGALLSYLIKTQKNALKHIVTIQRYYAERFMLLNRATGPYKWHWFGLLLCNAVVPQLLWLPALRHSGPAAIERPSSAALSQACSLCS